MAPSSSATGKRAYFFGAGASKQDRLPVTGELKHGIAWAICHHPARFEDLTAHLRHLFNVDDGVLHAGADAWDALRSAEGHRQSAASAASGVGVPDVTEWLSTLDWMIREQTSFGPGRDTAGASKLSLVAQLARVRDLVVQALCVSLGSNVDGWTQTGSGESTTDRFMSQVEADAVLITTNWDLLLDIARHRRFGTTATDYGTAGANIVLEQCRADVEPERPRLLKLHGSLSWRYCPRCQRLVINPRNHVAGDRSDHPDCECSYPYSELIVTPGFVREYRNVHLLTIWREALFDLALADEWVFVGYSLPPDDVGIRALLLRARCIREDVRREGLSRMPRVTIVAGPDRDVVHARFRSLFPDAHLHPGDFARYVSEQRVGA